MRNFKKGQIKEALNPVTLDLLASAAGEYPRCHFSMLTLICPLGIDIESLNDYQPGPGNARKVFQWIYSRRASRPEDIAYCLLGLLSVQIPIVHGEGRSRAFYRLQLECSTQTDDRDLFIWGSRRRSQWNAMFAEGPAAFVKQQGGGASSTRERKPSCSKTVPSEGQRGSFIHFHQSRPSHIPSISLINSQAGQSLFQWDSYLDVPQGVIYDKWRVGTLGTIESPLAPRAPKKTLKMMMMMKDMTNMVDETILLRRDHSRQYLPLRSSCKKLRVHPPAMSTKPRTIFIAQRGRGHSMGL
ncbi:hypothetical protein PLEOSDRAFT_1100813 [Pleurotus ostreatus PC15]|uniref:Uncharacterized protein n=1 Tax=Pleurotus ostreatus (strain PC15) TaxID=1137138 RepID=A0A067NWB5_PLEO1|nr:hypothetical protein PLEOSDRAFT_1100813 [Pleurotus ostreatus PC15]